MRSSKNYAGKAGSPPGKPVFTGVQKTEKVHVHVIDYNGQKVTEHDIQNIEDVFTFKDKATVSWIDICGLHDVGLIEKLCNNFSIHPLVQEDIVHLSQRPKIEEFDNYIFFVLRMIYIENDVFIEEQMSIIQGENYVITFQEKPGDLFNPIRDRIRNGKFQISKRESDYLAYSLIDNIVDNYFVILEEFGNNIEIIEEKLLTNPSQTALRKIHKLKRRMLSLRRSVWPLREVINKLDRTESTLIKKTTKIYVRDIYDHTIQVIDTIENFRDMLSAMIDTYLSSLSNRMNEVMKTLTIIATIFIPLTFIAGVYGMNFEYMPELKWHFGYLYVLAIMALIALIMLVFFKRKKWL